MKPAVLVIDMLNDFILDGAPLECSKGREIIKPISKLITLCRNKKIPIIYVADSHDPNDKEFKIWPPHAVENTRGAEVIDELKPLKGDIIVKKKTYDGFFKTNLDKVLKGKKIDTLILTGVCTDICIMHTASSATLLGYIVKIPKECVAALTEEDHNFALKHLEKVLKSEVNNLDNIIAQL
ncbi:MAG: isochorismatase family cysteine hydrolase [Candidatus Jordarchaeaceae archaeon]